MSALILAIKPVVEFLAALIAVIAGAYRVLSSLFRRRGLSSSDRRRLIGQMQAPSQRVGEMALAGAVGAGVAMMVLHDHSGHAPPTETGSDAFGPDTASLADGLPDGATALGDLSHDLPVADGAAGVGDILREILS